MITHIFNDKCYLDKQTEWFEVNNALNVFLSF